jgi:hypothetical protein
MSRLLLIELFLAHRPETKKGSQTLSRLVAAQRQQSRLPVADGTLPNIDSDLPTALCATHHHCKMLFMHEFHARIDAVMLRLLTSIVQFRAPVRADFNVFPHQRHNPNLAGGHEGEAT